MAASRARWLVTASRTGRGGKAEPALLKWTTLATPGVSDLSNGTSRVICSFLNPEQSGERWRARWPRWTPQDRPVVDGSKPASGPAPQAVTVVSHHILAKQAAHEEQPDRRRDERGSPDRGHFRRPPVGPLGRETPVVSSSLVSLAALDEEALEVVEPAVDDLSSVAPRAGRRQDRLAGRRAERARVGLERLDVAVAVALVAEAVAAAEARDVLQLVAVLDGVPVQPLDLSGPRELGKLPPGQRLDLVADLVSGHRRGCSASCRPGLPRGDRGRDSPVQACPALHRWSSSPSGGLTIALPLNLCESPPLGGCRDVPCRR